MNLTAKNWVNSWAQIKAKILIKFKLEAIIIIMKIIYNLINKQILVLNLMILNQINN